MSAGTMAIRQPVGLLGDGPSKVVEKSSAVIDWARSGLTSLKAKINKMKAEIAVVEAIKEVRDEFLKEFLSGLNDAEKAALANDKAFQKELSSLTRESDKELSQSTEAYELVSKLGAIIVKTALGLAGGALLGAVGDLGILAANGNRASTANFKFNAGDKINEGLANEIAIIQTVMSKLTSVTPEIVAQIENGKFTKEQIKDVVKKEVDAIIKEAISSIKEKVAERPKEEPQSAESQKRSEKEQQRSKITNIAEQDNGMGI